MRLNVWNVHFCCSKHVDRIIGREEHSLRDLKPLGSPNAIYEITTQDVYARNKAFELMTPSKMNIKRSAIGKTRPTETESNLGFYVWESPSTSRARTMGVKVVVKSDTDSGKTSITTAPYSAPKHMRTATVVALPAKERIETGKNNWTVAADVAEINLLVLILMTSLYWTHFMALLFLWELFNIWPAPELLTVIRQHFCLTWSVNRESICY